MGLERERIRERVRPIWFETVDENSPPRGGGNEWRATMGGLASESQPWLDQFGRREREREIAKAFHRGKKKSIFPVLNQKEKKVRKKKNY